MLQMQEELAPKLISMPEAMEARNKQGLDAKDVFMKRFKPHFAKTYPTALAEAIRVTGQFFVEFTTVVESSSDDTDKAIRQAIFEEMRAMCKELQWNPDIKLGVMRGNPKIWVYVRYAHGCCWLVNRPTKVKVTVLLDFTIPN
jgi:hypothetical protein